MHHKQFKLHEQHKAVNELQKGNVILCIQCYYSLNNQQGQCGVIL